MEKTITIEYDEILNNGNPKGYIAKKLIENSTSVKIGWNDVSEGKLYIALYDNHFILKLGSLERFYPYYELKYLVGAIQKGEIQKWIDSFN